MSDSEAIYDPDLPDANAVMASLCCVAARYATHPSTDLAQLAANLSRKLTAPQYAGSSKLVSEVAQRLVRQWEAIVIEQSQRLAPAYPSGIVH